MSAAAVPRHTKRISTISVLLMGAAALLALCSLLPTPGGAYILIPRRESDLFVLVFSIFVLFRSLIDKKKEAHFALSYSTAQYLDITHKIMALTSSH
jgi:hypothetical protein